MVKIEILTKISVLRILGCCNCLLPNYRMAARFSAAIFIKGITFICKHAKLTERSVSFTDALTHQPKILLSHL